MLKVRNLTKHYNDFSLDKINFQIGEGLILGISGANGAGKTTLMKLLSKSIQANEGEITLNNKHEYRDILTYHPSIFPFETFYKVSHVLYFYDSVYETFDLNKASQKLKNYEIDIKTSISKLSLGQKQKLILAIILSIEAQLILLDEPTDGVDVFVRNEILSELQTHVYNTGATLIIATHQLHFYEDILDYILYLEDGKQLFFKDMITFKESANDYLIEKTEEMNLKNFSYTRQKEHTYDPN
ncbi:MAG TPA: ABC transporter ATP-binding protein [Erysipelothrix sp.]|nr:ABC transporter ATP-binding protein [Erysipelothrix sp.]